MQLADAAGNDHKNDHHRGEQPSSLPLLSVREEGDDDDHENTDQREHALPPRRGRVWRWHADYGRNSAK
jgi:hypothetical protein